MVRIHTAALQILIPHINFPATISLVHLQGKAMQTLRRAPRIEKPSIPPQDPLELCLSIWAEWMHRKADKDLEAKTMRTLKGDGDAYGKDASELDEQRDIKIAEAVDATVASLPRIHQWAISKSQNLARVWNFPHAAYVDVLESAQENLRNKLRNNICTGVLFAV
jgi:hypothetical protein